jgi:hypothetical protein
MDGQTNLELDRPRSIGEQVTTALTLYRRVPVLFLLLAAIVVVPYELIVLAVTHKGPLGQGQLGFIPGELLFGIDSFLVSPLVSALHAHAVREVGDGGRPRLLTTVRRSLPTLLAVGIAAGVSWVAITLGTLALVVPGLILWAMWAVVAQTAALEGGGWIEALRRSASLTEGHRWHALGVVFVASLIAGVPWFLLWQVFRHSSTTAPLFLAGTALQVLVRSFEALIAAILYFDLTARSREGTQALTTSDEDAAVSELQSGTGDPLAPDGYTDQNRPRGWYVDPSQPHRMRYWAAGYQPVWSQRTAKTPKQTLEEWRQLRGSEPDSGTAEEPN